MNPSASSGRTIPEAHRETPRPSPRGVGAQQPLAEAPYGKDHHARSGRGRRRPPRRGAGPHPSGQRLRHRRRARWGGRRAVRWDGHLRRHHPGRHAAQGRRLHRGPAPAPGPREHPHPAAHRPRCHQRQDLRLRLRRRRLHDQALLPRRASGPLARPHAAPGRCRLRDAHRGRPHAEPGIHGSHLRKRIHSPVAEGVRHRPHPAGLAGGGAFEGAAHQPRLGSLLQRFRQQRGGLHLVSAEEKWPTWGRRRGSRPFAR